MDPLNGLVLKLTSESDENGDKDRKQTDQNIARMISSEETASALRDASLEQLDLLLAIDELAVEVKPLSALLLLSYKAAKVEQLLRQHDQTGVDPIRADLSTFVHQISRFLCQVPVFVAVSKEITRLCSVCQLYAKVAIALKQSIKTVYPLRSFLLRYYRQENASITPIHSTFFYICLHSKCYFAARELLNRPYFEVHAQASQVVDFLEYAYYGGVLLLGFKNYRKACDFFMMAITAPATALSEIVVESIKKFILASLISRGRFSSFPKCTSFVVTRAFGAHCELYSTYADAYVAQDLAKCAELVQANAETFVNDKNLGLVRQSLVALKHQKLLELTRVYSTISFAEISNATLMEDDVETEKMILRLIVQQKINATVDSVAAGDATGVVDKMVSFHEDQEAFDNDTVLRQLHAEMERLFVFSSRLRELDAEIITNAKFVAKIKEKERRRGGAGAGAGSMPVPGLAPWEDSTMES